jgi:hypothetical protein
LLPQLQDSAPTRRKIRGAGKVCCNRQNPAIAPATGAQQKKIRADPGVMRDRAHQQEHGDSR